MTDTGQREAHLEFTSLAQNIDSKIDPDLKKQIKELETLNEIIKSDLFGNEELIPVGSCVDGSKVTVPNDSGDIDLLIISNKIILKEYLFDYHNEYPAFLHIRVTNEHEKYFQPVNDPIEGVYLPASALKELQSKLFFMSKVLLSAKTKNGLSEDGILNVTRPSAVGKEQMKLYPVNQACLGVNKNSDTMEFRLKRMENFAKFGLGAIMNLANDTEETDIEDDLSTIKTHDGQQTDGHNKMSLLEMLHKFLDLSEGNETSHRNAKDTPHMDGLNRTDDTDSKEKYTMQETDLNKDEKQNARCMSSTNPLTSGVYDRRLSQDCLTTVTKRNKSDMDSVLDSSLACDEGEYKRAAKSEPAEVSERSTKCEGIEKPNKDGTAKNETSFSKLKSTDFVPAFKFEGWPRVAEEWVSRSRKWPSKGTIKKVLELGCQVVAKRPLALHSKPITEERDPYFRLSFALSEIALAQSMKEQQLLCWRVLKAYQKCYLETSPKCLTTYHWKNVLFWVSEDLDESFWTDENVLVAVKKCLDFMVTCLQRRSLPFYFVMKMNLFNGCHEGLIDNLRIQVEAIRREPLGSLKRFLTDPPSSETHLIETVEIENILSKETKAQNIDKTSMEMVNGFTQNFQSFCKSDDKGETKFPQEFHKTARALLQKALSEEENKSAHASEDAQTPDSFPKKMIGQFGEVFESMENEDGEEIFKRFDDLLQLLATKNEETTDENATASERNGKQSCQTVLSTLSSVMKSMQEDDGSPASSSNVLADVQKCAVKLVGEFDSKHKKQDEPGKKENKEGNGILSTVVGTVPKFFKALQNSFESEEENVSVAGEFRKVLNEASKQIEVISRREDKTETKSEMDIDLD